MQDEDENDRFIEAHHAVRALSHGGDDALRRVAALLREDRPDPALLKMLAAMIDPDKRGWLGARLIVKRTRRGAPKSLPERNPELAHFIAVHCILLPHPKVEAVAAAAFERFGCARSAFFEALRREKAFWTDDRLERHRATARLARKHGIPGYEPL